MTDQERDMLRPAAWDKYKEARTGVLALESKLGNWAEPLFTLGHKIQNEISRVTVADLEGIPKLEDFAPDYHGGPLPALVPGAAPQQPSTPFAPSSKFPESSTAGRLTL